MNKISISSKCPCANANLGGCGSLVFLKFAKKKKKTYIIFYLDFFLNLQLTITSFKLQQVNNLL